MVSKTTVLNVVQAIPGRRVAARVLNANVGLFTATVKTKVLRASMSLDAVGADATYALAILRQAIFIPIGDHVVVNRVSKASSFLLEAGDTLTNVGDAGSTNGTTDMDAYLQEQS